ncbi:hypothetical protein A2634_00530 [Candidatus Amesbacteria bacterium RIFCSPHIGHO2_01_FULL_48_32]|uniref:Uncharacterized protein n=1 Tax=Candidatus Amesbacteria bacterium RIFCSPLOWO2_01_FULL_48_25 TaxID=1797259 RepID=A0A1F4ZAN9_9BACT|nr:MAG: hypothetical protein A2634_00530 [Candidatus Amesbacteria bacterium RIFCSPHIGHO2_01_FULL_48_32]OGD03292.1 MAG: hypothetical protein A2989_00480 [Candidatus Amesbacteria bacterium RIFCSPLOWO2_01_FULL_48_25]HJZ05241.1 hypothetical protein [Patescibacteria group bacterium]
MTQQLETQTLADIQGFRNNILKVFSTSEVRSAALATLSPPFIVNLQLRRALGYLTDGEFDRLYQALKAPFETKS